MVRCSQYIKCYKAFLRAGSHCSIEAIRDTLECYTTAWVIHRQKKKEAVVDTDANSFNATL